MEGVRPARRTDRAAVIDTVSAAFARDPAWSFLLGEEYDRLAPHFAGALFDSRVESGVVWVTSDVTAVSMWDRLGGDEEPAKLRSSPRGASTGATAGVEAWTRLRAYEEAVDTARPLTPYWYLGVLATRPDHQGTGRATSVIAPVLERADGDGLHCCLETSTVPNREFYGRRGFTDVTDVHIASGPPTWWLCRAPRPR